MIETNETIDEFLARHADDVSEAVRKAAAQEILPRRRRLAAHEVDEKAGPHDLVTDADRKAEQFLTEALSALLPGSVVVGEEAVHANPATYEAIRGEAPVWIVDPVDGHGSSCTATRASAPWSPSPTTGPCGPRGPMPRSTTDGHGGTGPGRLPGRRAPARRPARARP